MSSMMTNASAMTALQTLKATNKQLEVTQSRISTGYRVAQASDNAAYWSIATTMRSDNSALSTVQDSLGLGAATVDVAYTAMDDAKDYLIQIRNKIAAATAPGVDKAKIQGEISELQNQIKNIADNASFSGSNWLSADSSSAEYSETVSIVGSFTRGANNAISLGKINVDMSQTTLFDASTADGAGGLLDGTDLETGFDAAVAGGTNTAADGAEATLTLGDFTTSITLAEGDSLVFDIAVDGGETQTITISKATVDAALTSTDGVIADAAAMVSVLNQAFTDAGLGVTASAATDTISIDSDTTADDAGGVVSSLTMGALSARPANIDVLGIDITDASSSELEYYMSGFDNAINAVTDAASYLGSIKSRVDMQKDFVSNLMDAIDRGIGQLVDADMEEESTRLQALQVQQQLGIQALSIANGNAQSILSLFR